MRCILTLGESNKGIRLLAAPVSPMLPKIAGLEFQALHSYFSNSLWTLCSSFHVCGHGYGLFISFVCVLSLFGVFNHITKPFDAHHCAVRGHAR